MKQKIDNPDAELFKAAPSDEAPMPVDPEVVTEMTEIEGDFEYPDWFAAEASLNSINNSEDSNYSYEESEAQTEDSENDKF